MPAARRRSGAKRVSQPRKCKLIIEKDVQIPLRDGWLRRGVAEADVKRALYTIRERATSFVQAADMLERKGDDFRGRIVGGDGVQIDDAIDAVDVVLQLDEPADRAQIVAEMQIARGLHPRKHQGFVSAHRRSKSRIPPKTRADMRRSAWHSQVPGIL